MNTLVIASIEADARAAASIEEHHAELEVALELQVETVLAAAAGAHDSGWKDPSERLAPGAGPSCSRTPRPKSRRCMPPPMTASKAGSWSTACSANTC
jgi:hypothetical protein